MKDKNMLYTIKATYGSQSIVYNVTIMALTYKDAIRALRLNGYTPYRLIDLPDHDRRLYYDN